MSSDMMEDLIDLSGFEKNEIRAGCGRMFLTDLGTELEETEKSLANENENVCIMREKRNNLRSKMEI